MSFSSFRLSLLDFAARVLSRWLNAVNARIESHPVHAADQLADSSARADDNPPPPPDHWVEMVRQRAPQLIDPNADAGYGVIDYRADDALIQPPQVQAAPLTRQPARPVSVITPHHRQPVPAVKTAPQQQPRPMRLNNVTTRSLEAASIAEHTAQTAAGAFEVPTTPTTPPDPAQPSIRSPAELEAAPLPVRAYPDLPVEQHIHEIHTSFADVPDVPSVRTSASPAPNIDQRRTRVPHAPEQTVLRPSVHHTAQIARENAYNLWASLPESAPEDAYNQNAEQSHRARLRREQEGRAWSE